MKTWMKVLLIAAGCLAVLGLALGAAGLAMGGSAASSPEPGTGDENSYQISAQGITSLDIDWVAGNVILEPWEGEEIQVEERSRGQLTEKKRLTYQVDGDTLEIRFQKPGLRFGFQPYGKDLRVRIPQTLADQLRELEIENVSADFSLSGLGVQKLEMNTVSGSLKALDLETDSLEFESVSGDLTAQLGNRPAVLELETVSGSAELKLPTGIDLSAELDSVSGDFRSELPCISGSNAAAWKISMESVSGDLTILGDN